MVTALGAVGFTVIQNLTNAAINFGKQMVSKITEPMRTGFEEYETQINAIQTVLANTESKGTTLEDVSAALAELNTYADKTIYNFTEMTRNIGTFTAAGVDLDTSTAAIKGIANLAAVSGSTSQQASTAMYQLSQALSSGTVKLMDWNSVVNAGMGGQVFQDALMETARVNGIAIDDMIESHGSFRETLSEGWLSSDVLLQTLQKFTGDLSKEQLQSMGYAEDQIEAILRLGQTANDAATKVKTFTQLKDTLAEALQSGWTKSWEIIIGDFEEAKALYTEVSDTLGEMIGASADARNKVLQDWKDIGGRTFLIVAIRNAFEGVLSVIAPIKEAFAEIFPPITGLRLAVLSANLAKFTSNLTLSSETADKVKRVFKGVFSIFSIGFKVVGAIVQAFITFGKILLGLSNISGGGILDFLANMGDSLTALKENMDIEKVFSKITSTIVNALVIATTKVLGFTGAVKEVLDTIREELPGIIASITEFANKVRAKFEEVRAYIAGIIDPEMVNTIKNLIEEVKSSITGIFDKMDTSGGKDYFNKVTDRLKQVAGVLIKLFGGIFMVLYKIGQALAPILTKVGTALWNFLKDMGQKIADAFKEADFNDVTDAINTGLLAALALAMGNFLKQGAGMFEGVADILEGVGDALAAWQMNLQAKTLLMIAGAIAIMAASLIMLTLVDSEKLAISLGLVTGLFANLTASMVAINKTGGGSAKAALTIIAVSLAVLILAAAMQKLADIDAASMARGIGSIYALTGAVVAFSLIMGKNKASIMASSIGLIAFAASLLVMMGVVQQIADMDPEALAQGLIGLGVMLAELAIFLKVSDIDKMSGTKGLGMLAMAAGILKMAKAVGQFGEMDVAQLQQGLLAIAAVLGELAIFAKLTADGPGFLASAAAMLIMAISLKILTEVLKELATMEPEELIQSLIAIGVALAIMAVGLYAMTGTLAGSAALLVAAFALMMLTPVLKQLGEMSLEQIGMGLLALAGVFLVLGLAGLILAPVVPVLLLLGVALLLLGVATTAAGFGLTLLAAGLAAIAVSGVLGATALVGMVTILLTLIPIIIAAFIGGLILFAQGVIKATPIIGKAITGLMLMFLQIIIDVTPKVIEALRTLLEALLALMLELIPDFVSAMFDILFAMIDEIILRIPEFVQAGFDILIGFLSGIRDNIADVVTVVVEIVTEFIGAVAENLPDIIQSGFELMIAFIDAMAEAVDTNMQPLLDAIGRLATSIIDGLLKGIQKGAQSIIDALVKIAKDAWQAAKDWLMGNSPAKRFIPIGEMIPNGIAVGIEATADKVPNAAVAIAKETEKVLTGTLAAVSDAISGEIDIDPVIRPVVDLSEVESGGALVNDLFNRTTAISLDTAVARSNSIATGMSAAPSVDAQGNVINEGAKIVLNQTNYSPKALSRSEIYRQTHNQMIPLKGLVNRS